MLAIGAHYHGFHVGRHFVVWQLARWGFRGPLWHPLVLLVVVAAIATLLAGGRRRGGPRGPGGPGAGGGADGDRLRRDASGRLEVDRELEERSDR